MSILGYFVSMTNDHSTGLNAALAAELRAEMAAQGLTDEDISGRSELTSQTVGRIRRMDRGINVWYLDQFARALGIAPAELLARASRRLAGADRKGRSAG